MVMLRLLLRFHLHTKKMVWGIKSDILAQGDLVTCNDVDRKGANRGQCPIVVIHKVYIDHT